MIEHNDALVAAARAVLTPSRLTRTIEAASVGAALRTSTCAMHLGVCLDAASGIGFSPNHWSTCGAA